MGLDVIPTSPAYSLAFFSIIMNVNKFVFDSGLFGAVFGFCNLVKPICERDSICRRSQRHSVETGTERICATVHSANAEIQLGDALRRFDGGDSIARHVDFLIA